MNIQIFNCIYVMNIEQLSSLEGNPRMWPKSKTITFGPITYLSALPLHKCFSFIILLTVIENLYAIPVFTSDIMQQHCIPTLHCSLKGATILPQSSPLLSFCCVFVFQSVTVALGTWQRTGVVSTSRIWSTTLHCESTHSHPHQVDTVMERRKGFV